MEKIFDKFETAQALCEELYSSCSANYRAGMSIRINGGSYADLIEHSDWRDGKSAGWYAAEELINNGRVFFVYPFECERTECPTRFQYGGFWACNKCNTHISTPEWWKIKVMKDGNKYCCVGNGFINLQESNNYAFGDNYIDAINNYWHLMMEQQKSPITELNK
jgi:hypothetical protein